MATRADFFAYESLDSDQADSFRLLSLLPGEDDSPIECTLIHTRRSTPSQPYEALSYAWGDPSFIHEIIVNGLRFPVAQNLQHALRNLRPPPSAHGSARTLWVDALCIDQSHILKWNHQVAQMKEVYANAEQVVIWLSDASDDSDMAIAFMKKVWQSLVARGVFSLESIRCRQDLETDLRKGMGDFLVQNSSTRGKQ
jgi:hypothetical protein